MVTHFVDLVVVMHEL